MNKPIKSVSTLCIALTLVAAALSACVKEGTPSGEGYDQTVIRNLEISTRALVNDDGNATTGEDKIYSAMVYIFQAGTDVLDNPSSMEVSTLTSIGEVVDDAGKLNKMWRVPVGSKDVFVVANPDAELKSRLTNSLTQAQLKSLLTSSTQSNFTAAVADISTKGMLMSGSKTGISVSPENATVTGTIPVTRRLARISLMLRKAKELEGATVIVKSIRFKDQVYQGSVYPVSTPPGLYAAQDKTLNTTLTAQQSVADAWSGTASDYMALADFYTFERAALSEAACLEMVISFDGTDVTVPVYLCSTSIGGSGHTGNDKDKPVALEANTIYRVMATLGKHTTDLVLSILDWNDVAIDGNFTGAELAVSDNRILMDWWNFSESFSTKLDITASENITFLGYEHNGSTTTDGSNLPLWLPLANITGITSGTAKTETIGLTYKLDGTVTKYPVYLWFQAGNIKKRVEIVYDNGYLPNSLLTPYWTSNLPSGGGIHVSKIGFTDPADDAKTFADEELPGLAQDLCPAYQKYLSLEDVGTGAYLTSEWIRLYPATSTTVGAAAGIACRNLGSKWYMPSYNELWAVMKLKYYLGVSYSLTIGGTDDYLYRSYSQDAISGSASTANFWTIYIFADDGYLLKDSRFKYWKGYHNRCLYTIGETWPVVGIDVDNTTLRSTFVNYFTGQGPHAAGSTVSISAAAPTGYHFVNWTCSDTSITMPTSASGTFTMPNKDITITASIALD